MRKTHFVYRGDLHLPERRVVWPENHMCRPERRIVARESLDRLVPVRLEIDAHGDIFVFRLSCTLRS